MTGKTNPSRNKFKIKLKPDFGGNVLPQLVQILSGARTADKAVFRQIRDKVLYLVRLEEPPEEIEFTKKEIEIFAKLVHSGGVNIAPEVAFLDEQLEQHGY